MATAYPDVLDELSTMRRVVAGASLARYGDGEFKMCNGRSSLKCQQALPTLAIRLQAILQDAGSCMVGIPNLRSATPKAAFWAPYLDLAPTYLNPAKRYVSAFVTRPDSAPWVDVPEYWDLVESLWLGRHVTLVRGSRRSLTSEDLMGAGIVTEIICPAQNAFHEYDAILKRIGTPERALLCLGPTATVLAVDLAAQGVHAIDLGHVGMFLKKHRKGLPMWVTKKDKSADREPLDIEAEA